MGSSAKKWESVRPGQHKEIGFVQVDIWAHGKPRERPTSLALNGARDLLKDALARSAQQCGGRLACWEDDRGTFMFLLDDPDSFDNCCAAAIDMLERLPWVKRKVQLSDELERLLTLRLCCDTGTATRDPAAHAFVVQTAEAFRKHREVLSAENKLVITERIFGRLKGPLKDRFVKWKHAHELGVDLYAAADTGVKLSVTRPDSTPELEVPEPEEDPSPDPLGTAPAAERAAAQGRSESPFRALKSRKVLAAAAAVLLLLVAGGLARYVLWPPTPMAGPTPEWREWRRQVHDKLSAGNVTEKTLAEALGIKPPARPEHAPAALRHDQAMADVLMGYPEVRRILKTRFGIYEDAFLGTGLSKPSSAVDYGKASVHEYLIANYEDNHDAVWMRILDPKDPDVMNGTVGALFDANDPKLDDQKKTLASAVIRHVREKGTRMPAVIRFAALNPVKYSRKLGRSDAYRVFASDLAEVWDLSLKDAAELSGYLSGDTLPPGDKIYVWAFLPTYPEQVVLATWGNVLNRLPKWLSETDRN